MRILILLSLISNLTFAHEEKVIKKSYENVEITTFASGYIEEMNKTLIIAQYAEILSKELKYTDKIYLLFSEQQLGEPLITSWIPVRDGSPETDGIHIMFRFKSFSISGCLNVIENSLLNVKSLKKYRDKNLIAYNNKTSVIVEKVLGKKIYRPNSIKELEKSPIYSYYLLNGKYNFFRRERDNEDKLAVLENVLDYQILSHDIVIVFNNSERFLIYHNKALVGNVVIEEPPKYYWPYESHLSGNNKIIIEFNKFSEQINRVMIYYLDKNEFIQDIDKAVRK